MKTLLVLSGGMDSTTLLYKLLKEGKEVETISFDYGQKHRKELDIAKKTCEKLGVKNTLVHMDFLKDMLSDSALTSDEEVPEGHYADENMKRTVVPNRNMIMASIAIGYAVNAGMQEVALGIHAGDHAIYPDCRPAFFKALAVMAEISNYEPINIYAPYLYLDKGEIVADGIANNVDYALTWTCYKGEEKACGKCGSCVERLEAFANNNVTDPVEYQD